VINDRDTSIEPERWTMTHIYKWDAFLIVFIWQEKVNWSWTELIFKHNSWGNMPRRTEDSVQTTSGLQPLLPLFQHHQTSLA